MHKTVENIIYIENEIKSKISDLNYKNYSPKIIAVAKTFNEDHVLPLVSHGHTHFGENKVQEAITKWIHLKKKFNRIELHMLGKLQTNKVKNALKIFDFIHSLDSLKLAHKISQEQKKILKRPKIFIQINIGEEPQKSGIKKNELRHFYKSCLDLNLDIVGTMTLPPEEKNPEIYFKEQQKLNESINLGHLSMGMSNDYLSALKYKSTFLRIGTKIFGLRNN